MVKPHLPLDEIRLSANDFFAHFASDIPMIFEALLCAEDHRAFRHNGIDYFSICRALVKLPVVGRICGISTVEQQLARIIFPRRGSKLICKVRELAISREMATLVAKEDIWACYLQRAFYGSSLVGYEAARAIFCSGLRTLSWQEAAAIVSCLKYPRPEVPTASWQKLHNRRKAYVIRRLARMRASTRWPLYTSVRNSICT